MRLHATEAGAGSPVVLLHGLFGSARNFGLVQKRLAARWRVIALDLRNHGASGHDSEMSYAAMAADVAATLAALGAQPAAVIGHSMGGKVAMRLALEYPAVPRALVVADIAPRPYPPHFAAIAASMAALPLASGMTRAAADAALADTVPDAALRGFLMQNFIPGGPAGWRIGLAEIIAALEREIGGWAAPVGATWPGPTLVLTGAQSDYVTAADRGPIRALFPAARFVALHGAGHWLHADNPDGFLAAVGAFLEAVL
ncbi:MAG: alpha/beta fold hydrolase [Acetobacteraceae bacterium]